MYINTDSKVHCSAIRKSTGDHCLDPLPGLVRWDEDDDVDGAGEMLCSGDVGFLPASSSLVDNSGNNTRNKSA